MGINGLDLLLLAVLAFTIIRGVFRGLMREVMGVVAVGAALLVAGLLYHPVGDTFSTVIDSDNIRYGTAYVLTFGVLAVVFALVGWFLDSLIKQVPDLGPLNQAGGLVFGGFKGALLVATILLCLRWFPNMEDTLDESALEPVFEPLVDMLADQVDQVVEEKLPEMVAPLTDG
jgi:membrane protein required for colicin V production